MAKIIIPRKMSNSGTIHDIASEHHDIEIDMTHFKYVLILASYYNGKSFYRTKSLNGLRTLSSRFRKYSYTILDEKGNEVYEWELLNHQ